MPRMTGSQFIADFLDAYEVSHVFFVPAILNQTLAQIEFRTGIKRILTHGEKSAAYMADGYARAGGRPGVCFAQCVGAANLAALGWYEWMDSSAPRGATPPSAGLAGVAGSFAWVITLGYVSLLILMTRFGLRFLTARLAPVGRMAFTNYLTQTLIMATLFYLPWGPHLFGDPAWGPGQLWAAVGAIWIAQLIWSPLWLSVFQMGPLEWLWRCLTYGRMVPLRKAVDGARTEAVSI